MDGQLAAVAVEEDQVELEAHGEGVDAGAARDQQAGAGLLAGQAGETEQAAAEACRDRDDVAEDLAPGQCLEALVIAVGGHGQVKARDSPFSPPLGPGPRRFRL